jgi:hypothetical protein
MNPSLLLMSMLPSTVHTHPDFRTSLVRHRSGGCTRAQPAFAHTTYTSIFSTLPLRFTNPTVQYQASFTTGTGTDMPGRDSRTVTF